MIDHLTLRVHDLAASKAFYERALAPLGYTLAMSHEGVAGFGVGGKPDFWIAQDPDARPQHVAFAAKDRPTVDAFHAAALAAGGKDNGPPGLRPEYHPSYYGAFVLDPSGHNMEAVCHARPAARKAGKGRKAPPRGAARGAKKAGRTRRR